MKSKIVEDADVTYVVVCDQGDEAMASLTQFARAEDLEASQITGLPRIEASDSQANPPFCDRTTGANCVNPPAGAQYYPFFSTTNRHWECTWQEGGKYLPGTINDFGGSSTTEFGPRLKSVFPVAGFKIERLFDNFHSGNMPNPCRLG